MITIDIRLTSESTERDFEEAINILTSEKSRRVFSENISAKTENNSVCKVTEVECANLATSDVDKKPENLAAENRQIPMPPPLPKIDNDDVDVTGEKWDPELHSRTRSKTKDGKWRIKRGVDTEETHEVPLPPVVQKPTVTFPQFVSKIQALIKQQKASMDSVMFALKSAGFADIPSVAKQPEKIPELLSLLADSTEE